MTLGEFYEILHRRMLAALVLRSTVLLQRNDLIGFNSERNAAELTTSGRSRQQQTTLAAISGHYAVNSAQNIPHHESLIDCGNDLGTYP